MLIFRSEETFPRQRILVTKGHPRAWTYSDPWCDGGCRLHESWSEKTTTAIYLARYEYDIRKPISAVHQAARYFVIVYLLVYWKFSSRNMLYFINKAMLQVIVSNSSDATRFKLFSIWILKVIVCAFSEQVDDGYIRGKYSIEIFLSEYVCFWVVCTDSFQITYFGAFKPLKSRVTWACMHSG